MKDKVSKEDLWCEYSDLPSPLAYVKKVDSDKKKKSKKKKPLKNDC